MAERSWSSAGCRRCCKTRAIRNWKSANRAGSQAAQGVRLMNVPANVTRAAGDVHALGNPHFMTDPIIAKTVAQHIAQSFAAVDPPNAASYDANYKKFEATINAKLQEWGAAMLPFKGQNVVAYHDSWVYFAHRFGLNIDIFLEPKPGIPPRLRTWRR